MAQAIASCPKFHSKCIKAFVYKMESSLVILWSHTI